MWNPTEPFDDKEVIRRFNLEALPVLKVRGSEIGEKAMQGDVLAEDVIRRYNLFQAWLDPFNLNFLEVRLKEWLKKNTQ